MMHKKRRLLDGIKNAKLEFIIQSKITSVEANFLYAKR
jgi:hypothetical protein